MEHSIMEENATEETGIVYTNMRKEREKQGVFCLWNLILNFIIPILFYPMFNYEYKKLYIFLKKF